MPSQQYKPNEESGVLRAPDNGVYAGNKRRADDCETECVAWNQRIGESAVLRFYIDYESMRMSC